MTCNEAEILLHALLDGELDAGNAHQVEMHVENCPRCAPQLHAYRELQQAMPVAQLHFTAPTSLRRRIEQALPAAARPRASSRRSSTSRRRGSPGPAEGLTTSTAMPPPRLSIDAALM